MAGSAGFPEQDTSLILKTELNIRSSCEKEEGFHVKFTICCLIVEVTNHVGKVIEIGDQ